MKPFFVLATAFTLAFYVNLPQAQAKGGHGGGGGGVHMSVGGGGGHTGASSGHTASAGGSAHAGGGAEGWGNNTHAGLSGAVGGGVHTGSGAGSGSGSRASSPQSAAAAESASHQAQVQTYNWPKSAATPSAVNTSAGSSGMHNLASSEFPAAILSSVAPAAAAKPKHHYVPKYYGLRRGRGYYNPNYYDPNDPTDPNNPNNPSSDAYRRKHHLIPGGDASTASASQKP